MLKMAVRASTINQRCDYTNYKSVAKITNENKHSFRTFLSTNKGKYHHYLALLIKIQLGKQICI